MLLTIVLLFASCMKEAKIQVVNDVHNVIMTDISWGDYSIFSSLMPGEASDKIEISEYASDFPQTHRLKFYLSADGNTVFLETKEYYELDVDDFVRITITDTTEVVNPLVD